MEENENVVKETVGLLFMVDKSWRQRLKIESYKRCMTMVGLVTEAVAEYIDNHPVVEEYSQRELNKIIKGKKG